MTRGSLQALALLAAGALAAGCLSAGSARPDERFGHRFPDRGPEGRVTVLGTPPPNPDDYFVYPAVLDTVHVRPQTAALRPGEAAAVEVLLKGVLPDACSELNEAEQTRVGRIIEVTLTMRQPRGTPCALVVRPFRFYLPLEGTFEAGAYVVRVNGAAQPFRIRALEGDG
ncbi:MAG: hypothetical protein ACK41D_05175 [Rubricoccaceae bacterium]